MLENLWSNISQIIVFYPLQQRKPAFLLDSRLATALKLRVEQYPSTKNNDNGRFEMVSAKVGEPVEQYFTNYCVLPFTTA